MEELPDWPFTLKDICGRYIIKNLKKTVLKPGGKNYKTPRFRKHVYLPHSICTLLVEVAKRHCIRLDKTFYYIFYNTSRTSLRSIMDFLVAAPDFVKLMKHKPHSVDVPRDIFNDKRVFKQLNRYQHEISFLRISCGAIDITHKRKLTSLHFENLASLTLVKVNLNLVDILRNLSGCKLSYLELHSCIMTGDSLDHISKFRALETLKMPLTGLNEVVGSIALLSNLQQLRHLDLSDSFCRSDIFRSPGFLNLLTSLEHLKHLDLYTSSKVALTEAEFGEFYGICISKKLNYLGLVGWKLNFEMPIEKMALELGSTHTLSRVVNALYNSLNNLDSYISILLYFCHRHAIDSVPVAEQVAKILLVAMKKYRENQFVQELSSSYFSDNFCDLQANLSCTTIQNINWLTLESLPLPGVRDDNELAAPHKTEVCHWLDIFLAVKYGGVNHL